MRDLGTVRPGSTIYLPWHTFDSNDPSASVTMTGLVLADIQVYKNGGTTQRASTAGFTLLDTDGTDFDAVTGVHGISIDLSDNTTAGFWTAGAQYWVVVSSVTVDAATINFVLATFTIGYPDAILNTTIATLASQTSFTLSAGSADNSAYIGFVAVIHDVASDVQLAVGAVSGYTGATKTITLSGDPAIFTMAAGDNISLFAGSNVRFAGSTLWGAGAITAATIAADAIGASELAADGIAEIRNAVTGGAYALDTDANGRMRVVDGTGAGEINTNAGAIALVDTVTTNADMRGTDNALLAASAPTNFGDLAITVTTGQVTVGTNADKTGYSISGTKTTLDALNDVAATEIVSAGAITTLAGAVVNVDLVDTCAVNTDMRGTDSAYTGTPPTAAAISDAVWDKDATAHQTLGTFGQAIGDPVANAESIYDAVVTDAAGLNIAADIIALDAVADNILLDTAEIGTAGAGLTNINLPDQTMNITGSLSGSVGSVTGAVGSVTGAVGSVTGHTPQTGDSFARLGVAGAGLTDLGGMSTAMKAEVNAEVVDVLTVDTSALTAQGAPTATPTLEEAIIWLYKMARNKIETTSTTISVYDDVGTTVDHKSTISDNGTTFTRGEFVTGP